MELGLATAAAVGAAICSYLERTAFVVRLAGPVFLAELSCFHLLCRLRLLFFFTSPSLFLFLRFPL